MYLLLQYICRLHEVFYYARISFLHHNLFNFAKQTYYEVRSCVESVISNFAGDNNQ